jgi:hypothetical protein
MLPQRCVAGGAKAQLPPAWLNATIGPIDEEERANTIPVQQLLTSPARTEAPLEEAPNLLHAPASAPAQLPAPGPALASAPAPVKALQQLSSGAKLAAAVQQGAAPQSLGGRRMAL